MAIFMHLNQTKLFLLSPAGILGSGAPNHQGCSAEPGHLRQRGAEKASRNYGWVPETLEQRENKIQKSLSFRGSLVRGRH